jgi:hypothetical protein
VPGERNPMIRDDDDDDHHHHHHHCGDITIKITTSVNNTSRAFSRFSTKNSCTRSTAHNKKSAIV